MVILVDPPRWPAHGTVFCHLVSDASLDELHAFADDQGVPTRAFVQRKAAVVHGSGSSFV